MTLKNICLTTAVLITFLSCHKTLKPKIIILPSTQEITKIELSHYGGQMGYRGTLTVTKDSVVETSFMGTKSDKITKTGSKISSQEWQNLLNSFKLQDFKKIKSGTSYLPFDGVDTKIKISNSTGSDSIINGNEDKINFRKIEKLNNLLEKFWTKSENRKK